MNHSYKRYIPVHRYSRMATLCKKESKVPSLLLDANSLIPARLFFYNHLPIFIPSMFPHPHHLIIIHPKQLN